MEGLTITANRDPRFFTYVAIATEQGHYENRELTYDLARVMRVGHDDSVAALYSITANPQFGTDAFCQLIRLAYPNKALVDDRPVRLTVRHHAPFCYPGSDSLAIVGGGTRHDSAFAFLARGSDPILYRYLTSGKDISGNGEWSSDVLVCYVGDIDFDGVPDAILKNNPFRDNTPSQLFCVSLDSLKIKWQLEYFPNVAPLNVLASTDSSHSRLIILAVGCGHGLIDSLTNDQYGYLTVIDAQGHVISNRAVSYFGQSVPLAPGLRPNTFIIGNCLPFVETKDLQANPTLHHALSIVDIDGRPVKSVPLTSAARSIISADYDGNGSPEICVVTADASVRVFDSTLALVAEAPRCGVQYIHATLPSLDGHGKAIVFGVTNGHLIVNERLEPLALVASEASYVSPLVVDASGRLTSMLATSASTWAIYDIKQQTFFDYLEVAYFKYQVYVLAALSSLLIGLVVTNFYRSRVSRQKRALESAHRELAETHRALKEAQAQLVAQEKYRQAKDIAGGFAHEIRNALLPAEIAIERSSEVITEQPVAAARMSTYLKSAGQAVAKAIGITEVISQYTRLESRYLPEQVNLHDVITHVLESYRLATEQKHVKVYCDGPADIVVNGNWEQYQIVFTNLLLNSLDALREQAIPSVHISTGRREHGAEVTFADNGSGITPEHLPRIFETFFSTKPNTGTGLGLATSKKIIELYGGSIAVESAPGAGTKFTLAFSTDMKTPKEHTSDSKGN